MDIQSNARNKKNHPHYVVATVTPLHSATPAVVSNVVNDEFSVAEVHPVSHRARGAVSPAQRPPRDERVQLRIRRVLVAFKYL